MLFSQYKMAKCFVRHDPIGERKAKGNNLSAVPGSLDHVSRPGDAKRAHLLGSVWRQGCPELEVPKGFDPASRTGAADHYPVGCKSTLGISLRLL